MLKLKAPFLVQPAVLLSAVLGLLATPAAAQVTVDLHALDTPSAGSGAASPDQQAAPARKPPARKPPAHNAAKPSGKPTPAETKPNPPAATATAPATSAPPSQAAPGQQAAPKPEPPAAVVGTTPPPAAVIPEPAPADVPMPAPPPPPITASAGTTATPLPGKDAPGVRIDFPVGQSDLTQDTANAVQKLAEAAPKADTTSFNVMAYASGVPEDPSTARRLSLSRALAVRSVLMAAGVPSARIYVRALGSAAPEGPTDRVDLTVMGGNAAARAAASPASGSTGGTATP
jgi:outer membrane protein OmpA-like peptidoglycan-associated protein